MLDQLSAAVFTPLIGETFVLCAADGGIDATLVEAAATGDPLAPGGRAPFELVWEGPEQPRLQQGLHEVRHPSLDASLVVFLVPIAQTPAGIRYQAIFT